MKNIWKTEKSVIKNRLQEGTELFEFIEERLHIYWPLKIIALKWNEQHENDSIFFNTIYSAINTPDARVGVAFFVQYRNNFIDKWIYIEKMKNIASMLNE